MNREPLRPVRDRILDAARELYAAKGFHAVGVQEIADAAGTTKKTLYSVYRNKDHLNAMVILDARRRWDATVERAAETADGQPVEKVGAVFAELARDPVGNPVAIIVLAWLELDRDTAGEEFAVKVMDHLSDFFEMVAQAHGVEAADTFSFRALSLLTGASVLAARLGLEGGGDTRLRQASAAVRLLLTNGGQRAGD